MYHEKRTAKPVEWVEITCPIMVEGFNIAEFEAAVEVEVTYKGKPNTWGSPAESPEYIVHDVFVDAGHYSLERRKRLHDWRPAPDDLKKRIEDFLDTDDGRAYIIEEIVGW